MLGLHPAVVAVIFVVIALSASAGYLLTHARSRARTQAGILALSDLKWREFAQLVLEALRKEGYVEEDIERQPGDSGFDFVLSRNGERVLLSCKHGRHFRLGEANVRDFATAVRMHGVAGGIIATLGSIEGFAREVAEANQIQVIDGAQLWQRVEGYLPTGTVGHIDHAVDGEARRRVGIASAASIALGAVLFVSLAGLERGPASAGTLANTVERSTTTAPAARIQPAASQSGLGIPGVNGRGEAPVRLGESDLLARRQAAVQTLMTMPAFGTANWSTQSTLVLGLAERDTHPETIAPLVEEACEVLVQFEELRFTRLQLEPPPGVDTPVRWRQCR